MRVARKDVNSVYIGSNDYWQFDNDTFNDQTQFYGKAWLVPSKDIPVVDREEFISDNGLSRCQMFFEVGKTDAHLFTPTKITYDDKAKLVLIKGNQGSVGQPEKTTPKTKAFALEQLAQRYKNVSESKTSNKPARFMVNYIITDEGEDKENIKAFIESLNKQEDKDEEEIVEETTEINEAEMENLNSISQKEAENMEEEIMNAEEMNAENLPRVNPTVVEGAEDVHGAEEGYSEDGMANPEVFGEFVNDNVIGQDFSGQVIGQNAEEEGYSEDGMANPEVFGEFVNDNVIGQDFSGQVIGQNAEELPVQNVEDGISEEVFGDVGSGNDFGQYRSESYDYDPEDYSPYDYDPESYDPMAMEADNIVDFVQDYSPFRLSGWLASTIVVGVAALSGAYFAKKK